MTRRRAIFAIFNERTILVLAAIGVVLYGYPGLMSYDSVDQLDQARRWQLGDWHPPAMALLWRTVELFVAGPFGMLVLQVTALVIGCGAVLRRELGARTAAIITLAICWFPPIVTVMGVIWKDAQMAGYLMLGLAALGSASRVRRWLGLGLFVVAGAMRHNAAAATLVPMLWLWAPALPIWKRRAAAIGAWLAITAASFSINHVLASTSQHPFETSIAVTDIVGTLHHAGPRDDAELRALLAGTGLRIDHDISAAMTAHDDLRGWAFYYAADPPIPDPTDAPAGTGDDVRAAIRRAWLDLVIHEPLAYLHHRWDIFHRLLNIGRAHGPPPLTQSFAAGDPDAVTRIHHDESPSLIQRAWFAVTHAISGIWYAPFVYFVVALVLIGFSRRAPLVQILLGSGVIYELSFFPFAPSADTRYSQWMTLTTLLALVLVVVRRARAGRVVRVDQ